MIISHFRDKRPRNQESTWKEFKRKTSGPSSDRFQRSLTSHDREERPYHSYDREEQPYHSHDWEERPYKSQTRVERSTISCDRSSGERENLTFYWRNQGYQDKLKVFT